MAGASGLLDLHTLYYAIKKTLLIKWDYQAEVVLLIYCIGAVMKVKPIKGTSWFHHLILIFLTGFAGGIITPLMLGKPPVLFANDLVIPFVCIAWYLVHHTPFEKVVSKKYFKYPILIVYEISRANGVMKMVSAANTAIPASYFHTPLVGPVMIGTLYGCLGAFLPFDRGLAYIEDGVPQNIEVAFLGSLIYHIAVYDPTLIGAYIRGLPFFNFTNPDNVKIFVVLFFITMALSLAHFGPTASPLEPLHAFLYQLSGLPLPASAATAAAPAPATPAKPTTGAKDEPAVPKQPQEPNKWANVTRMGIPVVAVLAHMLFGIPTRELTAGKSLEAGQYVASCNRLQVLASGCKQHFLTVEGDGSLAVYRGDSPADASKERVWSPKIKKGKNKLSESGYYLMLTTAGNLELRHKDSPETIFWTSQAGKAPAGGKGKFSLKIAPNGTVAVYNSSTPVWLSDASK